MSTQPLERFGEGYLEERKLVPRWPAPLPQLANLLVVTALFYASWWVVQDPRGWMRLYTPYVGYNYTRWLLIMLIWMVYIFNYWPFKRSWLETAHPLVKGLALTTVSVALMIVVIKGFFEYLLGNFAISYFNPDQLAKLERVTEFFAEEYSALAILMFAAIASWLSPSWVVAMERAPWAKEKQPVQGLTILLVTFFLSTIVYFMTMHSHMAILYYPWQVFTGITPPYWEKFADTVSGNFHISWIMCCTVVVWLVETIWERYPFSLIKHDWSRRIATFLGIIVIAWACHLFLYFAQDLWWGEAVRGTRRDFAPDWRWLHVGEMMIFWLLPSLVLAFYFDNWPRKMASPIARVIVRTVVTLAAAAVIYWLYYNFAHLVLGTQKGFSHPQQFPMIPTIWYINILLINHWFMDNYPGWKLVPSKAAERAAKAAGKTSANPEPGAPAPAE
jgi:AAT family amino acid transporter